MKTHTKQIAIFPGTFDPVTNGHIDLVERALRIFDEVIVAVAHAGTDKKPLFSIQERIGLLRESTKHLKKVLVEEFDGLVVDYAKKKGANAMVRGIRMVSDFEYEFQMALTNRKLDDEIETIFLMPHESYAYLSSRLIKEVAGLDGNISHFVPTCVAKAIQKKFNR